jgi:hypothetical protein
MVYWWFRRFVRLMLFQTIYDIAVMMGRERAGREASPSAGIIDSQTVRARRGQEDGRSQKAYRGRYRRTAVDGQSDPADLSDSAGAQMILDAIRKRWPRVKHLFADGAYDRTQLMEKAAFLGFIIEVVHRIDGEPGFRLLPRRWRGRASLLVHTLAPSRARLRATPRCLPGHDPCRHGRPLAPQNHPLRHSQTDYNGGGDGAAAMYSIVQTTKMNDRFFLYTYCIR